MYSEKAEQEIAEGCRRLIKNAIICWNYLYLSQLIAQEEDLELRRERLTAAKNSSVERGGGILSPLRNFTHLCSVRPTPLQYA